MNEGGEESLCHTTTGRGLYYFINIGGFQLSTRTTLAYLLHEVVDADCLLRGNKEERLRTVEPHPLHFALKIKYTPKNATAWGSGEDDYDRER